MSLSNAIILFTNVPILLVAIYAAMKFKRLGKELKVFALYLFLSALIQISSLVLYLFSINNMPLLHVYTSLGGVILILFYQKILTNFLSESILFWVAGLFFLFTLVDTLFFESIFNFNRYALIAQSVIVIILGLATFSLLLKERSYLMEESLRKSINWINSGAFIYFCSSLLLYYFITYMEEIGMDYVSFRKLWTLHSLFMVTMYTCFFIGLWKSPKH